MITTVDVRGMPVTSFNSFIQSSKSKDGIEYGRRSEPKQEVPDALLYCDPKLHYELVKPFGKSNQNMKNIVDSFPLVPLHVNLLLASCYWLKGMTTNVEDEKSKGMGIDANNIIAVVLMCGKFVVMYQVFMIQKR